MRWGARQGEARRLTGHLLFSNRDAPIYLLMIYTKGARADISPEAKKLVREFAGRESSKRSVAMKDQGVNE